MNKNILIFSLGVTIAILIGIVIVTNFEWFSQEWLIGLGIVVIGFTAIGIFVYSKIKKNI
ncbi:hypothetical protein C6989_06990 [Nitrosopumilus sp. b2]|nr:hypothetical protein C6989_06990 [Nitrosopumilus sp. b2]